MARYFNNPAIGQAFANLASAFAPPSGADAAGYAAAAAKREEAARLAEFFGAAKDPSTDWAALDRLNYGINGKAQDTFRYGEQDRAAAQARQDSINQTDITKTILGPLGANETRILPPSIAEQYGLGPVQLGNVQLGQGETSYNADGSTYTGAPKPLTEAEVKGAHLQKQPDPILDAIVFGNTPIERTVDGTYATRPSMIGQPAPPELRGEPRNYRAPDGRTGLFVQDPRTGAPIDAATGEPLPQGSVAFSAQAQGTPDQLGVAQSNRAQMLRSSAGATRLLTKSLRELVQTNPGASGTPGRILGLGQDLVQTARELGSAFGENPEIAIPSAEFQAFIQGTLPGDQAAYNPVYSQARALVLELAYNNARLNNPSGEVSRFALEREIEALGQGFLSNDESLLAVLDIIDERTARKLQEADMMVGGPIPPPNTPSRQPALPGTVPGGEATTRRRFNPATGQLEPVQ